MLLSYDENRQVVMPKSSLVQQRNHRCHKNSVVGQHLVPEQFAGTAADDSARTAQAAWICAGRVWKFHQNQSETNSGS